MRRASKGQKLLVLALTAVLLIALLAIERQDRADKRRRSEILERAAPLEQQRDELILRRDARQRAYYEAVRGTATEQLLFLELDERLYSEIFPLLREREIVGVLGLSMEEYPGEEGKITREEMEEMLSAGWELCLVFQGSDFASWDREWSERLGREGIFKPRTVYFPEDFFSASREEEILRCGYTVAVHHGEDRLDLLNGDASAVLWLVGAHPWNYSGVKNEITELVNQRSEHCFTVRFSEGRETYSETSFAKMLDFIAPYREEGSLVLTGFMAARDMHDPALNGVNELQTSWLLEQAELNDQIRALEEQIQLIYQEWSDVLND